MMICNSPFGLLNTEVNAMIMYITDKNREIQVELFEGWLAEFLIFELLNQTKKL